MNEPAMSNSQSSYYCNQPGASGLFGAGSNASGNYQAYTSYSGTSAESLQSAEGGLIIDPNNIYFGGGSGSGGVMYQQSTYQVEGKATSGGPGAGGGGAGKSSSYNYIQNGGNGGMLGGGGGTSAYSQGGYGGSAAGGGGVFARQYSNIAPQGGEGLVIVQYARLIQ